MQLWREAHVLDLYTSLKCEHSVMLTGISPVTVETDCCWFVMELLDGDNVETVLKADKIIDTECIKVQQFVGCCKVTSVLPSLTLSHCLQAARNVLAALKVMHAAGLVHRDIKPANIMRCYTGILGDSGSTSSKDGRNDSLRRRISTASPQPSIRNSFMGAKKKRASIVGGSGSSHAQSFSRRGTDHVYKLIDFGTTVGIDDTIAGEEMMTMAASSQMGAGTPPYMSPEMFKEPDKARSSAEATLNEISRPRVRI